MASIDKERVLDALRASVQNPRTGEMVIQQIEAGEFDVSAAEKKPEKAKKPAGK
jgi:hypothetical protein